MSQQQIPVIVLTGFLGSGKTTLLNHLLHRSGGSRIGAIVNDFGSIEIDAMAVAGQLGDSTVSLGNGCLCCAVDAGELDVYLERLARPSARIDVIVIEASGLAEPQELVRMVLASENPGIVYGGLVQVVDAAEFDATRQRHPEVDRHLRIADLVVVNKVDRVPGPQRDRVLAEVRRHTDRAAVVAASYGRVDVELVLDRKPVGERVGQLSFDDLHDHGEDLHDHGETPAAEGGRQEGPAADGADGACSCGDPDHAHLHAGYESVAFTSEAPLNPRRLMAFLDSRPEGLYRIKGYVDFGAADARNRYGVHSVGRFLRFYPEPWAPGEKRLTQLVLIGSGIDVPALHAQLTLCRENEEDAPATDEFGMWGVLRFVQEPAGEEAPGAGADGPAEDEAETGDAAETAAGAGSGLGPDGGRASAHALDPGRGAYDEPEPDPDPDLDFGPSTGPGPDEDPEPGTGLGG
ncbi:cobalamin biosynthesis protein CobW [Streptomyces longispororuber]|uniref:Cobalamin biosynthesis protein CobW n=1 Tax=Streptomyces longispororuber TaxID=68230 RepID=A0A918Z3I8_9ACTN|nr:CobW family GTP-binding protein [Streptomyces longispororuber]GHE35078.1 cobalamin biosynthesis protein CobW [Streptomyces longispororuber]